VLLGIFFDFFDGFFARKLDVSTKLGLQLDSLADMVTSGVVPAFAMFFLLQDALHIDLMVSMHWNFKYFLPFISFVIALGSAFRLAKFNIDSRQSDSFIGLPTPANTLFILSLPLIAYEQTQFSLSEFILNPYVLILISLFSAYILNAELSLFSLKFKDYSWHNNMVKYILIVVSVALIISLKYLSVPLIVLCYIALSVFTKKQ